MTTLIQQLSPNDCALASIAMAAGCESWHDLWTEADLERVVKDKGVGDEEPWMKRAGFLRGDHYKRCYVHEGYQDVIKSMLWKRRALISVRSLNNDGGSHMVYWDGQAVFDPSPKRTYLLLHSMILNSIIIFAS